MRELYQLALLRRYALPKLRFALPSHSLLRHRFAITRILRAPPSGMPRAAMVSVNAYPVSALRANWYILFIKRNVVSQKISLYLMQDYA